MTDFLQITDVIFLCMYAIIISITVSLCLEEIIYVLNKQGDFCLLVSKDIRKSLCIYFATAQNAEYYFDYALCIR